MKLAIAYSTKDRVELTKQSLPALLGGEHSLLWIDGSRDPEALKFFEKNAKGRGQIAWFDKIYGGADAAIVFKLSTALGMIDTQTGEPAFTHIGLVENDVLLDADWLEPTLELFERGRSDGLEVGAVSARSYVDRVLIQRDGFAVMHNLGAGTVIFTRQAAELVLNTFRTHWAPHIRQTWMRLAGIDIGRYWAFRGNDQWVTSDWGYDAVLASYGFASLALTPVKCQMIGQVPSLAEQGLELTTDHRDETFCSDEAFELFADRTRRIREGHFDCNSPVMDFNPCIGGERIVFPHQGPRFGARYQGNWRLQWSQGFGPFAYRAGEGGASVSVPAFGSCSFMVSGGASGARCRVRDTVSGYAHAPDLHPVEQAGMIAVTVPGAVTYRLIELEMSEGGVFYGYHSPEDQPSDPSFGFDYSTLPLV